MRIRALAALLLLAAACGDDPVVEPPPPSTMGSALITWEIRSTSGEPLNCTDIDIDRADVSIGGEKVPIQCGETMSQLFDGLLQGRFPVIVELITLGSSTAFTATGNVVVEGGKQATLHLVFEINLSNVSTGSALVRWRIDEEPASFGCGLVDGVTVKITELAGSISEVDATSPCSNGNITLTNLRPGGYGLLLELIDSTGSRITVNSVNMLDINAGETAMPAEVVLITQTRPRAALLAQWTVNSSVATTGCEAVNADTVVVKAFPDDEVVPTLTATAACEAGSVFYDGIIAGMRFHRVVYQLYSGVNMEPPIPQLLTSTTVREIAFREGQTSTVTVDLRTQ